MAEDASSEIPRKPGKGAVGASTDPSLAPLDQQEPKQLIAATSEEFTIQEVIGCGGMGVVYRAQQQSLRRSIALKKLHPVPEESSAEASQGRKDFLAEAWTNGQLEHPNIAPVYQLGCSKEGELFLAMKLVEGRSWQTLLKERPVKTTGGYDTESLLFHLEILLQVSNAVAYSHDKSIVHNDLKPGNVMVGHFGEVLVMDWGLAVSVGEKSADSRLRHRSSLRDICGTPAYMAPEQAAGQGDALGLWTDVYLLGGILYRILSDRPPHTGESFEAVVYHAFLGEVEPLDVSLPDELRQLCRQALNAEPRDRFEDASAFREGLQSYVRHRESIALSRRAQQRLEACRTTSKSREPAGPVSRSRLYESFATAVAGFEHALEQWAGNRLAVLGELESRLAFAETALLHGDLGLANTQATRLAALLERDPDVQQVGSLVERRTQLTLGIAAAERRRGREAALRKRAWLLVTGALTAAILTAVVFFWLDHAQFQALIAAHRAQLEAARAAPPHGDPGGLRLVARTVVDGLIAQRDPRGAFAPNTAERLRNLELIDKLLGQADWWESLVDLAEPRIGTERLALLPLSERQELSQQRTQTQRLAVELAVLNHSYDMAELIVRGLKLPQDTLDTLTARVEDERGALLRWQEQVTRDALADLRAGRSRPDRPGHWPTPEEYVVRLSAFRHPGIVAVLEAALAPYRVRAARETLPIFWSLAERDELQLILRVLGHLDLPDFTLKPLTDFMAVVDDWALAMECGWALCRTGHPAANDALLLQVRDRFGEGSNLWHQVARLLPRLPLDEDAGDPRSAETWFKRGNQLLYKARYEDAVEAYSAALELRPQLGEVHLMRASAFRRLGQLQEALADLDRAAELKPELAGIYNNRGDVYFELDALPRAIEEFNRALELDPGMAISYTNRGLTLMEAGLLAEALPDFDTALGFDPFDSRARKLRGRARFLLGDLEGALEDFNRVLELDHDATAYLYRANIRLNLGQLSEAWLDITRAIEIDPSQIDALRLRATVFERQGRWDEALRDRMEVVRLFGDDALSFVELGQSLIETGQLDAAVEVLDQALRLQPQNPQALLERGKLRRLRGELILALTDLARAVEISPDDATVRQWWAVVLIESGDDLQGFHELDAALALDPELPLALVYRGRLLAMAGGFEAALEDVDRALHIEPDFILGLVLRAVLRDQTGELAGSYEDYLHAHEVAPQKVSLVIEAACVAARLSERADTPTDWRARAFELLAEAVHLGLPSIRLLEERQELEPLHADPRWQQLQDAMQ